MIHNFPQVFGLDADIKLRMQKIRTIKGDRKTNRSENTEQIKPKGKEARKKTNFKED